MVLVKKNLTWYEAFVHCREHHDDLAVMHDRHQRRMVQERAKMADSEYVWVGLHFACFFKEWLWVDGHLLENDKKIEGPHECDWNGAVARDTKKWEGRHGDETYNFVCSTSKSCQAP